MAGNQIGRDYWLRDADVDSDSPANVEVAQGLAGRARILWELATGDVPDGEAVTARNPQGLIGVDCSGPPWGSAHRYPVAVMAGRKVNTAVVSSRPIPAIVGPSSRTFSFRVWHRPYEVRSEYGYAPPLARGYLAIGLYSSAGTPTVSMGCWANDEDWRDANVGSQAVSTTDTDYFSASLFWRLRPGRNVCRVRLSVTGGSTVYCPRLAARQLGKR